MTVENHDSGKVALTRIAKAAKLWFLLDYDGTLAEFVDNPDQIVCRPDVVDLLKQLVSLRDVRVAVVSGRRLAHMRELLPVTGLFLAGTYGVELCMEDGTCLQHVDRQRIRPILNALKPQLATLLGERPGFYLEDKGLALAVHGRFANAADAAEVLPRVHHAVEVVAAENADLIVLGGDRFVEIAPILANKGRTIAWLLHRFSDAATQLVCMGDDDKDEAAFAVVRMHGGLTVAVGNAGIRDADLHLPSPAAARSWLKQLAAQRRTQ